MLADMMFNVGKLFGLAVKHGHGPTRDLAVSLLKTLRESECFRQVYPEFYTEDDMSEPQ